MKEGENLNVAASAEPGAGGTPNPPASNEQQATIDGQAQALFELLTGKLDERFNELTKPFLGQLEGLKKVQGDIDRSRNDFQEKLKQLNKLTKSGLSQEEALAQMEAEATAGNWQKSVDERFDKLFNLLQQNGNPTVKQTVESVFQKYGLDVKDPRVAPELAKTYKTPEEIEMAALKTFHAIQTSPQPNAAQNAALNNRDNAQRRNNQKDISNINDSATLYDIAAEELTTGR